MAAIVNGQAHVKAGGFVRLNEVSSHLPSRG